MTTLDEAIVGTEPAPETARSVVRSDRKCRRHDYVYGGPLGDFWLCRLCHKPKDDARSRRGRSARRRGVDYERDVAAALGGVKVGMYGGAIDVQTDLLAVQVKVRGAFPSWMADELAKLPRTGGRIPTLVVADSPGPGRKRRALVVMALEDFASLHGR